MNMIDFSIGLTVGTILTCLVLGGGLWLSFSGKKVSLPKAGGRTMTLVAVFGAMLFLQALKTFAQATQEPLEIPTGVIFSETNNWMETFAPIAAIGIGISIALAVLGYLGKMIKGAFN